MPLETLLRLSRVELDEDTVPDEPTMLRFRHLLEADRLTAQLFNAVNARRNAMNPQFSPDGSAIAFIVGGALTRVPLSGGPAATIADEVVNYSRGVNDIIVYSRVPGPPGRVCRVDTRFGQCAPGVYARRRRARLGRHRS
jgi:hypothetical protein